MAKCKYWLEFFLLLQVSMHWALKMQSNGKSLLDYVLYLQVSFFQQIIFPCQDFQCKNSFDNLHFSAVLSAAAMFFMPESPYYLIGKGKEEEALKSLQWYIISFSWKNYIYFLKIKLFF